MLASKIELSCLHSVEEGRPLVRGEPEGWRPRILRVADEDVAINNAAFHAGGCTVVAKAALEPACVIHSPIRHFPLQPLHFFDDALPSVLRAQRQIDQPSKDAEHHVGIFLVIIVR